MKRRFIEQTYFVLSLAKRDIAIRFRGSLLGAVWLVINPLFTLGLYYYVFSVIFKVRWTSVSPDGHVVEQPAALSLFIGLIAFWFFSDCITRAPSLIRENSSYVKKVVFPLGTLPVMAVLSALFSACVNLCLLLIFYVCSIGLPSWYVIFCPVLFIILATGTLGVVYGLSALGMYIPDLKSLMGPISMAIMFLTPIMYPLKNVPGRLQKVVQLNPLSSIVEGLRNVFFDHVMPSLSGMLILSIVAVLLLAFGFYGFKKLRKGFADVL